MVQCTFLRPKITSMVHCTFPKTNARITLVMEKGAAQLIHPDSPPVTKGENAGRQAYYLVKLHKAENTKLVKINIQKSMIY